MRLAFLLACSVLMSLQLIAQPYSSPGGLFTVTQKRGCAPLTITVNAPTCDGGSGCDVIFENDISSSLVLSESHTFSTPGTYTVRVTRASVSETIDVVVTENERPDFQIVTCGGNRIFVFVTDTDYQEYVVDFGDGATSVVSPNTTTQHSYTTSGAKNLSVRGRDRNAADNCSVGTRTVNVVATLPTPELNSVQILNNNSVRVQFTGQPDIQYRIEAATNSNSSFQQVATAFNQTVDTITNILPLTNIYCFRVKAFDPCSNSTLTSNTLCTAITAIDINNNENLITWSTLPGTSPIDREQLVITTTSTGSSFTEADASSPFSDTNISCGSEYCYALTVFYADGNQSISLPVCGTAISTDTPDPIENISSVVHDVSAELFWYPSPAFTPETFSIFKGTGTDVVLLKTSSSATAIDSSYVESPSCYRVQYTDVCGNRSDPGVEACPMALDASLSSDNSIVLSWPSYNGWKQGVERYVIEKYDDTGSLIASIDVGTATEYTDDSEDLNNQRYLYRVVAIPVESGIANSSSNTVEVIKDPNLFYPASFTPNGDGLNDVFNVFGQYIEDFEMDIFNRWGELMATTTNLKEGWDGRYNGVEMPEGTYTFVANITDFAGRKFKKSGSILLLDKK